MVKNNLKSNNNVKETYIDYDDIIAELVEKEQYKVPDVCKALNKSPLTIRKWEREGIIKPPSLRDSRNWRVYSRSEFADLLEDVLDYPWKNNVFDNPGQIQLLIIYLGMGESKQ